MTAQSASVLLSDLLLGAMAEAVVAFDPVEDRILAANAAACRLYGRSAEDMVQTRMSALHPQQFPSLVVFSEAVLHQGSGWTRALSVEDGDGHRGAAQLPQRVLHPFGDG